MLIPAMYLMHGSVFTDSKTFCSTSSPPSDTGSRSAEEPFGATTASLTVEKVWPTRGLVAKGTGGPCDAIVGVVVDENVRFAAATGNDASTVLGFSAS